jgi:hypothetical protein
MISAKNNISRIALTLVGSPAAGHVISAPPVLVASEDTVDYTCGKCGIVLMHAELGQVHNLLIRCTECGAYNSTDRQS